MFLNEGFYVNEMSADPMDCMTLYAETVEAFARLDMAQVKAEHDAIMSEDTYMLNEALEEARDKTNQIIADAKAKLLEFIDKVKDKWLQIQSSINAKLLSKNKINAIVRAMENKKDKSFSTTANPGVIGVGIKVLQSIPSINKVYAKDQEDPEKEFEEIYNRILGDDAFNKEPDNQDTFNSTKMRTTGTGRYANTDNLKQAANFLKSRPQAIKDLTTLRRIVASYKGRAEKEKIKECQKALSKAVNAINKVTNEAITMVRDAGKAVGGATYKKDAKLVDTDKVGDAAYRAGGVTRKRNATKIQQGTQLASASILAGYGYYD
jgi:hypothetical protein